MINEKDTCISSEKIEKICEKKLQNPWQRDRCAQTESVWMKQAHPHIHKCIYVCVRMWNEMQKGDWIEYDLGVEFKAIAFSMKKRRKKVVKMKGWETEREQNRVKQQNTKEQKLFQLWKTRKVK